MPRVTSHKANKDYPQHGIKKGDTYYSWAFFRGAKQMSKTHPKPSQLTQTHMSEAYAAIEDLQDEIESIRKRIAEGSTTLEAAQSDLAAALSSAADGVREASEAYGEQADNIEEGFQHTTEKSDEAREKAESLESAADVLESASSEVESSDLDLAEEQTAKELFEEWVDEHAQPAIDEVEG